MKAMAGIADEEKRLSKMDMLAELYYHEADTRPRQGRHQPETHSASRYHFHYATQHRNLNFEF